jgi:hypothetical protein
LRLRVLLLLSAAVLAYVATRRSGSDADIWDGLEKDWWG